MTDYLQLAREVAEYQETADRQVKRNLRSVRQDLGDMLDEVATNDDAINQQRLGRLLSDVDRLMQRQADGLFDDTTDGMGAVTGLVALFLVSNVGQVRTQGRLNAVDDIAMRRWVDSLNLRDRTIINAGGYGDEIRTLLRRGAYQRTPVSQLRRQVSDLYDGKEWEIDRIVTTEMQNTYRLQFGHTAEINDIEYVQFNEEFPRHPNRENHACYAYAQEDPYGLGPGVFRTTDMKIYSPHPRCTSYLSLPERLV